MAIPGTEESEADKQRRRRALPLVRTVVIIAAIIAVALFVLTYFDLK